MFAYLGHINALSYAITLTHAYDCISGYTVFTDISMLIMIIDYSITFLAMSVLIALLYF